MPLKRARTETAVAQPNMAPTDRTLIQFVNPQGDACGAELEVEVGTTRDQLEELLLSIQTLEACPYCFTLAEADAEVKTTLLDALSDSKLSTERAVSIRYHPLSEFKVRPVTRCTASMEGHTEAVLCAAFSSDSSSLATGSGDGTVRLWDLTTCLPDKTCKGHTGWVLCVAWQPAGDLLISAGVDKTSRVWKSNGALAGVLKGHSQPITCVIWRPIHLGSPVVATAGKDAQVIIYCAQSFTCLQTLTGHISPVMALRWSGDGELFSAGRDRVIKVWAAQDRPGALQQIHELKGHAHWVNSLALSSDSVLRIGGDFAAWKVKNGAERLLSASDDFTMILWANKKIVSRLLGHQKPVNSVRFSPDGRFIASASFDRSIRLWSGQTGKFINAFRAHVGEVYLIAWSADSRSFVSASKDSTVKVWSAIDGKLVEDLPGHADEVFAVDWSADGSAVASGGRDKVVKIWRH